MIAHQNIATPYADRRFFVAMSVAIAVIVFAGFAPTFFLKKFFPTPELSLLFHLHGVLFTSWILLFIVQTSLVAGRRVDIHRRLGVVGGFLASAMLVVGFLAALTAARRGVQQGAPGALQFLTIPFGDLLLFGMLVGTGLYFRRKPQTHKRLLLLATIMMLAPAIARLPHIGEKGPIAFFGLADLFIVACFIYDRVVRGRIHPAFLWAGLLIVVLQPLRIMLGGTDAWLSFARWLVG